MKHVTIALLTPSDIIKSGISAILKSIPDIHVNIQYWTENDIQNGIPTKKPSIIIADSLLLNGDSITSIRNIAPETRIITMSTGQLPQAIAKNYDAIISIYDNTESISSTIKQCLITDENEAKELTPRKRRRYWNCKRIVQQRDGTQDECIGKYGYDPSTKHCIKVTNPLRCRSHNICDSE